jgi:hypothetical protein
LQAPSEKTHFQGRDRVAPSMMIVQECLSARLPPMLLEVSLRTRFTLSRLIGHDLSHTASISPFLILRNISLGWSDNYICNEYLFFNPLFQSPFNSSPQSLPWNLPCMRFKSIASISR